MNSFVSAAPIGLVELLRNAPSTGEGLGVPDGEPLPTGNSYLDAFLDDAFQEVPFANGKRYVRTKNFLRRCAEEPKFGFLTLGQIKTAVWQYPPALDKDRQIKGWLASDFRRFIRKDWPAYELARRPKSRAVDLRPFVDGTYKAPVPTVGGMRNDGEFLLYKGKWHTMIAPTAAGKSWFATFHAAQILIDGGTVMYGHFEESSPSGTVGRLLSLGVPAEVICTRFIWLDNGEPWTKEQFAHEIEVHKPKLVILDGINEACNMHGWDPEKIPGVGEYRKVFVTPAMRAGVSVLSLGHPPKAQGRQTERHGYGSSGWLDVVDGVGFRLVPNKENPIRRDNCGTSSLYSVKDREGSVEKSGQIATEVSDAGWIFLGSLIVDNSNPPQTTISVSAPTTATRTPESDSVERLAAQIVEYLKTVENHAYDSDRQLEEALQGRKVKFNKTDMPKALARLAYDNVIERVDAQKGKPRPGRLVVP